MRTIASTSVVQRDILILRLRVKASDFDELALRCRACRGPLMAEAAIWSRRWSRSADRTRAMTDRLLQPAATDAL